jgi:hypothetical protein
MYKTIALAPLLVLAACEAEVKTPTPNDETVRMAADADGRVAFNLPFAKGEMKLPTGLMPNADFDIDGVKMIPGGKITGFNLDAHQGDGGKVNFTFTAPSSPEEVKTYFVEQFRAKGMNVTAAGDAIQGKTKDGSTFRMRIAQQGTGTNGAIQLEGRR